MQNEHVPDGVWIDVLDQDGPLAEKVERPEGNELNEEGPREQVPRKRIRIKSKTTDTAAQTETDEDVFSTQEERSRVMADFSSTAETETTTSALASGEASGWSGSHGCSNLHPCVRRGCLPCKHGLNTSLRQKIVEVSHVKMTEEESHRSG